MINLNVEYSLINDEEISKYADKVKDKHNMLYNKTGLGNSFLGWLDIPLNYDKEEFERIKKSADKIQKNSDVLVVIGIGGSYLGARAVIESFKNTFSKPKTEIIYAGHNLNAEYLNELTEYIKDKDVSLNVISKSGTTIEPALAFRVLRKFMEDKYGKEEAAKRIFATTDKEKGALKIVAKMQGYETFVVPDDIGGRYSVLTAVGLLPIAVAGIDIDLLMLGAKKAMEEYSNEELATNNCYKYAVLRNILYNQGKQIEIMVNYEPKLMYFTEWFKQLYGESEGKDGKGIFPAGVTYTTDLHSLGQYVQDGKRIMFETILDIANCKNDINIEEDDENLDKLNYLEGKTLSYVSKQAMKGTIKAHNNGGVPNILIQIPEITEENIGGLIYFFEKACAISGYLLELNPFDQPGVEAYKHEMLTLLGK